MPGFEESHWCDQEVGWLLGRGVPCLPLMFQKHTPKGLFGKKQGDDEVRDNMTGEQIAQTIVDWLSRRVMLRSGFWSSMVEALKRSERFSRTDQVWKMLCDAEGLGADQVAGLLTAIRDNSQVYNASDPGGIPYSELVFGLAKRQPGYADNEALAAEVAQARGLKGPQLQLDPWKSTADPWRLASF